MKRFQILLVFAACFLNSAFALSFEVASITPCPPGTPANPLEHTGRLQFVLPGGRFEAKATTVRFLMEWAYKLQPVQHSAGPDWFGKDRFDIAAKAENNATEDDMRLMVQQLLAERFHLQFHREHRELPVFAFSLGKSAPKLTPSAASDVQSLQMSRIGGPHDKYPTAHVTATRFMIADLADTFARQFSRAVMDQTGLEGAFNFTLDLTPDETRPTIDETLLLTALREQVGLVVKADKASIEYFVIEGVDKAAAGNVARLCPRRVVGFSRYPDDSCPSGRPSSWGSSRA